MVGPSTSKMLALPAAPAPGKDWAEKGTCKVALHP
jgi:hypothetical protein